jgi:predicted nucleic acid-binding protein
MAKLILPDSNVYIAALRRGLDPFARFASALEDDEAEFATCGMVSLEVCRGLRDPGVLKRFRERLAVMIFLPTTNAIWERANQLAWSMDRQGVVIPASDIIIASCALHAGATVLTADAHFHAVPGLDVLESLE